MENRNSAQYTYQATQISTATKAKSLVRLYDYMYQLLVDANIKKEPDNIRTVRGMLEELKETWEGALVQLLQDYQAAHPEDEDFKTAISELKGEEVPTSKTQPQLKVQPARPAAAPQKAGSFTLAG